MRKEKEIKIEEGRDAGKVFKITEMPAFQQDSWATRMLVAMGSKLTGGLASLATISLQDIASSFFKMDYKVSEPLLQELLDCCSYKKEGTLVVLKKDMVDSIIEDWQTLQTLRMEALALNFGFFEEGDGLDTK